MKRTFAPLLALLSALAVSAAYSCGGDDDDDGATAGTGGAGGAGGTGGTGGSGGTGGGGPITELIGRLMANDPDLDQLEEVFRATDVTTQATIASSVATLFAPRNEAFTSLGSGCTLALTQDAPLASQIFRYHVLQSSLVSSDLESGQTTDRPTHLENTTLRVTKGADALATVNDDEAAIVQADIIAGNGAIHKIDKLLVPSGVRLPAACMRGVGGAGGAGGAGGQGGAEAAGGAAGAGRSRGRRGARRFGGGGRAGAAEKGALREGAPVVDPSRMTTEDAP